MNSFYLILFCLLSLCLNSCSNNDQNTGGGIKIDFKDLNTIKSADIITEYNYIKLESSDTSLFGEIKQIEIFKDRIYILDNNKTNAIFIFSINGEFITKIEAKGNGPGEFIYPHAFKISQQGYIFILDRTLNILLKYKLDDLKFIENIPLPVPSPLSFSIIEEKNLFVYYYPLREKSILNNKQFVIADKAGNIIHTLFESSSSGKILHGHADNFYLYKGNIRVYPHFKNKIYELNNDSLVDCYNLHWGKHTFPKDNLFTKYKNSGEIMKTLISGENEWIRFIYIYETDDILASKYYIKKDLYLSYWNKHTGSVINTKTKNIIDNIGMGDNFPIPIGIYKEKIIGFINPSDINIQNIKDKKISNILDNTSEESNPILVFYKFK